ncbi:MAG: WecB/TagA/CpsF family glycosyltransferase [Armatimonadota bacterium]|nr:WecB/TagA/CpsF family glycosyltransferase [Armatimonadota bacterium]
MAAEMTDNATGAGPYGRATILGIRIDRLDMASAVGVVRRFLNSGKPHMVVTADSAGLALAQSDVELRQIMLSADLVTPDSSGLLLGARLMGTPLIERVSGIDLAQEICKICAETGDSIYLLGAAPGIAESAAQNLAAKYPNLKIAGTHDGYFSDDAPVVEEIKKSGASVLFVAMGIPKQEKWIAAHLQALGVSLAIGLGGSFDVFSGQVKRAPAWMRNHGFEWLHRLISNPRKISKVAHLPRFAIMVLAERLGLRSGK